MNFTRGNLQLRDHLSNHKRVFLFQYVKKGYVQFIDELEYFDFGLFESHDREGKSRMAIKFFFKRNGVQLSVTQEQLNQIDDFSNYAAASQSDYVVLNPNITERRGLVTSRVGQSAYRKSVMHRWEYKCAVTEFDNPRILIASHIVPWRDSTNEERLDVNNGILLSPDFDALFDKHMISFDEQGKIMLGKEIQQHPFEKLGVTGQEAVNSFTEANQNYLEIHRQLLK